MTPLTLCMLIYLMIVYPCALVLCELFYGLPVTDVILTSQTILIAECSNRKFSTSSKICLVNLVMKTYYR